MPQTVEVRFKGLRRGFFLWPDENDPLRLQDPVVVQAERGQDFGRVTSSGEAAQRKCGGCSGCDPVPAANTTSPTVGADPKGPDHAPEAGVPAPAPDPPPGRAAQPASKQPSPLPSVLRRASPQDVSQANELRQAEEEARRQIASRARQHQIDMRVSDTEWQWDRSKLTVFFTAEHRVDFRALVRELAGLYRTRIELRQIGVRDEAARLGGVGRCGREFCCSTWLEELSPISLALAKDQHLSLNPAQISGGCGRLLCCLRYEHEFYVAARKRFPREGKAVATARGTERVVAVDIFRERVFLRHEELGPRIIPLVQFTEERDAASSGAPATPAPSSPPARTAAVRPEARRPAREPTGPPKGPSAVPQPPPTSGPTAGEGEQPTPPGRSKRRRNRRRRGKRPGGGSSTPPAPGGSD